MAVTITTDSACDLFPDIYKRYGVKIVPLYITIKGKAYRDVFEIRPENLFDDYRETHILPKTSAPPPEDFKELFTECTAGGGSVVHLAMNSKFSSSYQNACIAARDVDNVYVVNTFTLSSAQGLLVIRAAELRDEGRTAKEIFSYLEEARKKVRAYVLLDTLEYAYRGGRASMLQMFGANLLKLRPCLLLDTKGELSVVKKFRGNFGQVSREYARFVLSQPNPDPRRAFVSTTGMDKALFDEITGMVKGSGRFNEVLTSHAGCSMSTHTGENTLVIFYMEK
ncbi:MAG TPA: DegV family protein [Ruminococcaceae bacterium]|nr:DegV family protein [Oscillospiraceae bacterium]